ncbi:MAG: GGDEF domain-containing protein [Silicimonas sp.]|nr:GGDEF domain-containing protein [Silicimonas sp.]
MSHYLTYLLAPFSLIGWVLRLIFWSLAIAAITLAVEYSLGILDPVHTFEHAGLIAAITAPLTLLVMWLTQYLVTIQNKLTVLAHRDPLTGIYNRRAFFEAMESVGDGTVLMIDADHFKQVNDTYGHAVGDRALEQIAMHLQSSTRAGDIVGRLGGEEFAVFLAGADEERARSAGQRIAEGVAISTDSDENICITLSVGGVHTRHAENVTSLVNLADKMLYAAKNEGRSRLVMWPESSRPNAIERQLT